MPVAWPDDEAEEAASSGQEDGPAVTLLMPRRVERGYPRDRAPCFCDPIKRVVGVRCKKDVSVLAPGTAAEVRYVAEPLRRASRKGDAAEFAVGEECNGVSVRGPERIARPFGPNDRSRDERIDRADPETRDSGSVRSDYRDTAAVGRKRERSHDVGLFRRRHREAHERGLRRAGMEPQPEEHAGRREQKKSGAHPDPLATLAR